MAEEITIHLSPRPRSVVFMAGKDGGFMVFRDDVTMGRLPELLFAGELEPCLKYLQTTFTENPPASQHGG